MRIRRVRRGFTLIETLVSSLVVVLILVSVLTLFDSNSEIARVQTQMSQMQQSLRLGQYDIVRAIRMAGRGALPQGNLPLGTSLAVRNNVPANSYLTIGVDEQPVVLQDTDVLTLRGIFTTPIYQSNPASGSLILVDDPPTSGTLKLSYLTPTRIPQNLRPMADAIDETNEGKPDALLLVSPLDDAIYAVVELAPGSSYLEDEVNGEEIVTEVTLNFNISGAGTDRTDDYRALSSGGDFPDALRTVSFAGILEEYRFYIREAFRVPGDDASELAPRLSMARLYPGTEVPYLEDRDYLTMDIADQIVDLQVALGIDTEGDGVLEEDSPPSAADDWLFNSEDDNPADAGKWVTGGSPSELYYVRVTTLARTDRRDRGFQAPLLDFIEDKSYQDGFASLFNLPEQRMYRRRALQTIVDTRNLS